MSTQKNWICFQTGGQLKESGICQHHSYQVKLFEDHEWEGNALQSDIWYVVAEKKRLVWTLTCGMPVCAPGWLIPCCAVPTPGPEPGYCTWGRYWFCIWLTLGCPILEPTSPICRCTRAVAGLMKTLGPVWIVVFLSVFVVLINFPHGLTWKDGVLHWPGCQMALWVEEVWISGLQTVSPSDWTDSCLIKHTAVNTHNVTKHYNTYHNTIRKLFFWNNFLSVWLRSSFLISKQTLGPIQKYYSSNSWFCFH